MLPVAILAGGLGTRLKPVTETIPKALVEINGKPFLAHQLELLRARGVERVVLCVGYLGEMICEFAGDGARFGVEVRYSYDGPTLRGTAGALRNALPLLGGRFFVLYGDSYLTCDYAAVERAFMESGKPALMTVFRNDGQWDCSNVEFDGTRICAYEKNAANPRMRHIDYGLGAIESGALTELAPGEGDLAAVYRELLRGDALAAYEVAERFYEIGSPAGVAELSEYLR
jgi:N-acetyl-alpha-D-muramate 1-phosphate uridylyltransferase